MHAISTVTLVASLATGILAQGFNQIQTFTQEGCVGSPDIIDVRGGTMTGTFPTEVLSIRHNLTRCLRKFLPASYR